MVELLSLKEKLKLDETIQGLAGLAKAGRQVGRSDWRDECKQPPNQVSASSSSSSSSHTRTALCVMIT